MTNGHIEVRGLSKRYGDVWAAKQLSFTAQAGAFVTLLGPSGCGKTTTLRLIAGFITPDEGEIRIGDWPINDIPPWKRRIGVVFQNYALFPHLNVFDNIAFGLRRQGVKAGEIRQRVAQILDLVDLPGLEQRRPRQLSGGQQQRVALARALVIQPSLLLLDEPLSNLDAKLRADMRFELKRIQGEMGVTTIFVTHDQEEALSLSDYVIVMDRGEIRQAGTPRHIWEHPDDIFVADFFGVENMLPARAVGREPDGRYLVALGSAQTMTLYYQGELPLGETVTVGIRALDIQIFREKPTIDAECFVGKVRSISYKGDFVTYQVDTDLSHKPLVVTAPAESQLAEQVWLAFNAHRALLFPAKQTPGAA